MEASQNGTILENVYVGLNGNGHEFSIRLVYTREYNHLRSEAQAT